MAKSSNRLPTYVVNGLILKNGMPCGDFRGTWNWDGTPEGFFDLQDRAARDLAQKHRMDARQIQVCITAFVPCPRDSHNDIPVDSRAC